MLLLFGKVNFALKTRKTPQRDETGKIKEKGKVNLEKASYFLVCIVQSLGNLFVKKCLLKKQRQLFYSRFAKFMDVFFRLSLLVQYISLIVV